MDELPFLLHLPDGSSRATRFQHAVVYQTSDMRWLISSTHRTLEGAQAAAYPLAKADGGSIVRTVLSAEPAP